ncbi:MAG: alginate lyase family protein [Candidatus Cloacimonetes bacterium]|nr:alginate lyase family protein [Candidatus Cloacimonadota bacterium]
MIKKNKRRFSNYYELQEYIVKKVYVAARKLTDLNKGFICKLLASKKDRRASFFIDIGALPEEKKQDFLQRANEICAGRIYALNNVFETGDKVDWAKDYRSGFVWEKGQYFRKYVQVDLDNDADVKIPREISRFHFGLLLGIAYRYTQDEKYYQRFRTLILDWIEENPFMHSINWGCTQDIAIRAVNWIWALHLFQYPIKKDTTFYKKIIHSLYQHGVHVYYRPEKQMFNNHNHYLGDLAGQIYLGLLFSKTKAGKAWLGWGTKELFREMRTQILPSGSSYERSTNYHRLVADLCFSSVIQLHKAGYEIPQDIWYRLEKMLEFIMYYLKPNGFPPVIGDQDDARLHPFSVASNLEYRELLAMGAVVFNRSDFKAAAGFYPVDGIMLLGGGSLESFHNIEVNPISLRSKAFPDAGFYIIRQDKDYMFINNSGQSKYPELGQGTHTHSDLLSFELFMEDKSFIVDPGSYIYSADPNARTLFRSTKMHNTVVIDGKDQSELSREYLWGFSRNAIPKTLNWIDNDEMVLFEGEHSGYMRLKSPAIHKRRIEYNKKSREWLITDFLIGKNQHQVEIYFHFDADIPLKYENGVLSTTCETGNNIELHFQAEAEYRGEIYESWVSKAYSKKEKALAFKLILNAQLPLKIETKISKSSG